MSPRTDRVKRIASTASAILISFFLSAEPILAQSAAATTTAATPPTKALSEIFVAKPYVQFGDKPEYSKNDSLEILWLARDTKAAWAVEFRPAQSNADWKSAPIKNRSITRSTDPISVYTAKLDELAYACEYDYRVKKNNATVFEARTWTRKPDNAQSFRFIVVGDLGAGSAGQKRLALQMKAAKPDFLVMPGDIVYNYGLLSEYLQRFFPVYNADEASPLIGAPLIRSVPFVPVIGNHDIALTVNALGTDLNRFIDALAYFFVWSQPLNGPLTSTSSNNVPPLIGSSARKNDFLHAAGKNYPRMANYSFDYGNSHWLVLDANWYVDWSTPSLRKWVETDLKRTTKPWKFVAFHQPGFSCDYAHFKEQRMRLLSDIFESCGVDIVFAGHAHNYQRSFPLKFKVFQAKPDGTVDGEFSLDRGFDGQKDTTPDGVLYIVTGAGGARLYQSATEAQKRTLGNFMLKFISDIHSLTVCEVNGSTLDLKQVSANGNVLDQIRITKKVKLDSISPAP